MKKFLALYRDQLILAGIILIGLLLRFCHLGFQSFWLDEIHTAIESDPTTGWQGLFHYLKCCDQHPPLFFILEKLFIGLLGSSEAIIRSVSALAGTLSIWAIYLLGRELYSSRLGLIAAALSCINYFGISYSQEARPYALVALFAIFSFLYLIRFIKSLARKDSILYAVFSLLMLYSHYFGLFILISQIIIGILFWLHEPLKKKYLVNYLLAGLIIAIGFAPWLPFLQAMAGIKSFWIKDVPESFAIDYFYGFFGNSDLLKPVLLLLLLSCFFHMFQRFRHELGSVKEKPLTVAFLVCGIWIFVGFFIPFLRSVLVVPMLVPRYSIVLLPAFLLLLALGIELIYSQAVKYFLLTSFILLSLTDLFLVKHFYKEVSKSQFREMAAFVAADPAFTFPVVTDVTSWHQQYYLNKYHYSGTILAGKKEATLDSILHKRSRQYDLPGFWITGAHGEQKLSPEVRARLDTAFFLLKEGDFYDAWAQLYISRSNASAFTLLDHNAFPQEQIFDIEGEKVAAIWDWYVQSNPVPLKKGKYKIILSAKGTPLDGIFPHLYVSVNEEALGTYYVGESYAQQSFDYEAKSDTNAVFKIEMLNDAHDDAKREDRNAFIKSIGILRIK